MNALIYVYVEKHHNIVFAEPAEPLSSSLTSAVFYVFRVYFFLICPPFFSAPNHSVTSSGSQSGVFIPINLLQSRQVSPQLSIKSLSSPFSLATPPAMTLKFLGTFLQPKQVRMGWQELLSWLGVKVRGQTSAGV